MASVATEQGCPKRVGTGAGGVQPPIIKFQFPAPDVFLRKCLVITTLGALPSAAFASATDELFFNDLPIVASVSRLQQRAEDASASVTVIDRDVIKASGARDLNDIFRLVPGFQTFPNNTDTARVTYHGITDEDFSPRVQVLIDGRSQYSPLFRNGVNWAVLPVALEDIERVEVVRGTNTVSFGSNAFLGVINIITVDPALTHGVSVAVNHGNQRVRDTTLRAGGRLGEVGDFRFTYQGKDDDGLDDQHHWKDQFRSRMYSLRTDFWLTNRDQLQLSLGHVDAVLPQGRFATKKVSIGGVETEVLSGGEALDDRFRDFTQSSTQFQAYWRRALSESSDFQLRYAYGEDRGSDAYDFVFEPYLVRVNAVGDLGVRHELDGQHTLSPTASTRLVWGAGYRLDGVDSKETFFGQGTVYRRVARVFGNLEWSPSAWLTGNLGAASEYDSLAGRNFSPRISTNFHLNPNHTLRFGASRAYRTGSTADYRGDYKLTPYATMDGVPVQTNFHRRLQYGNPELKPEKINTVELAYLGELKALKTSLDVRVFRERISNRIYQLGVLLAPPLCDTAPKDGVDCSNPDMSLPIQDIKISGVEYQWRWQPLQDTKVMVGQAFLRIKSSFLPGVLSDPTITTFDAADKIAAVQDHAERSAPRRSSSLLVMQRLPGGVDLSVAGYWMDRMKWTRNTSVDSYRRFDVRLGYPFNIGGQRGEIAYTAQSINGAHGEFKHEGKPDDRIVDTRQWVSLRLDF